MKLAGVGMKPASWSGYETECILCRFISLTLPSLDPAIKDIMSAKWSCKRMLDDYMRVIQE